MKLSKENTKYVDGWVQNLERADLLLKEMLLPKGNMVDLIDSVSLIKEPYTNESFKNIVSKMKSLFSDVIEIKRNGCLHSNVVLHDNENGRLLGFTPFSSSLDGIAASESEGLIDETNQPLKAFWVDFLININSNGMDDFYDVVLVSWIPGKYIEIIDNAISESCDDSLYWID